MNKGLVFDIRRFSVHDGPGIRTTVFFKGCPLNCWWCHNPESQSPSVQECYKTFRLDEKEYREKEVIGEWMDAEQVMNILRRDGIFYEASSGGITFSGGEPLLQVSFLETLLKSCRMEGFHTAVDTSGFAATEDLLRVIDLADLFLYDLKIMDRGDHHTYTGVFNDQILKNLDYLLQKDKDVIVRIPVIPGYTDTEKNIKDMILFLSPFKEKLKGLSILPFHRSAGKKYSILEMENKLSSEMHQNQDRLDMIIKEFLQNNFPITMDG